MPTKTKHMARKASLSDSAPLQKQIKKEPGVQEDTSMSVMLDTAKVTEATKNLAKIPKKPSKTGTKIGESVVPEFQVSL